MKSYPNLSSPFKIGNVTIRNRFCVAPMSPGFTNLPSGKFTPEGMEYYVRRAKGGFGLIYTGAFSSDNKVDPINPLSANPLNDPVSFKNDSLELNRRANAYGTKIFGQFTLGVGRNYPTFYAPSAIPVYGYPEFIAPELTVDQIHTKIECAVEVAKLMKESGYAGVEVHALHWGYLLDEFAMSLTNKRTDEYGGSLYNRLRICKETVEAIKEACGKDFPVSIRLGMKAFVKDLQHASVDGSDEGGRTIEEAVEIAKLLEEFGYDVLSVDTGIYESFYYACPPMYVERGYAADLAKQIKDAVNIPVILGGRMGDPDMCEAGIADGKFDACAFGRPSLADPDFPNKVIAGLPEKVRPCIACNQGCLYRLLEEGVDARCALNPGVNKGDGEEIGKAPFKKHVIVVGGGVAGMEAARVAAIRGHKVDLYEKTDVLGGNLIPAGAHKFKVEIHELNAWYQQEIKTLNVNVHLNQEVTKEFLNEQKADAVILTVGSVPFIPNIPGIDKAVNCIDLLNRKVEEKDNVIVVGGGLVGCEIALECIREGKKVSIIEGLDNILSAGVAVPNPNKTMLIDTFEKEQTPIYTGKLLTEVTEEGAIVKDVKTGEITTIKGDQVVLAIGFRPVPSMASELYGNGYEVYEVGDGKKVGNIMTAIWDAYEVARML